jgi:hypothetical protein
VTLIIFKDRSEIGIARLTEGQIDIPVQTPANYWHVFAGDWIVPVRGTPDCGRCDTAGRTTDMGNTRLLASVLWR